MPRGPHSLSRQQVAISQRSRLLAALTEIAAAEGIEGIRIGEVCRRAGVSNSAFYAQFTGKGDALVAAYDAMAEDVADAVSSAIDADRPWREFVRAAVVAYLGVLDRAPAAAKLFIVESASAPPEVRARRRAAHRDFARLVRSVHEEARRQDPTLGPLPSDRAYLAVTEGVVGLVASHLEDPAGEPVTVLERDLMAFLVAVISGAGGVS